MENIEKRPDDQIESSCSESNEIEIDDSIKTQTVNQPESPNKIRNNVRKSNVSNNNLRRSLLEANVGLKYGLAKKTDIKLQPATDSTYECTMTTSQSDPPLLKLMEELKNDNNKNENGAKNDSEEEKKPRVSDIDEVSEPPFPVTVEPCYVTRPTWADTLEKGPPIWRFPNVQKLHKPGMHPVILSKDGKLVKMLATNWPYRRDMHPEHRYKYSEPYLYKYGTSYFSKMQQKIAYKPPPAKQICILPREMVEYNAKKLLSRYEIKNFSTRVALETGMYPFPKVYKHQKSNHMNNRTALEIKKFMIRSENMTKKLIKPEPKQQKFA